MLASSAEGIQLHSCGSHTDAHTHIFEAAEVRSQQRGLPRLLGCDWSFIELQFYAYFTSHSHTGLAYTYTHRHSCQLVWSFTHLSNQGHCLFFSFLPTSSPPPTPSLLLFSHPSPGLMNFTTWRLPVSGRGKKGGVGGAKERDSERIKFCWCLVNGSEVSGMASDLCCMDTLFKDQ